MTLRAWCAAAAVVSATASRGATIVLVSHGDVIEHCASWSCVQKMRPIRHAWAWHDSALLPVRFEDVDLDHDEKTLESRLDQADGQIDVRIRRDGVRLPETIAILAAPRRMWQEIPENQIPRHTVVKNAESVTLPRGAPDVWRFRIVGQGVGSWWVESIRDTAIVPVVRASDRTITIVDEDSRPIALAELAINDSSRKTRDHKTFARYRASEKGVVELPGIPNHTDLTLAAFDIAHIGNVFEGRIADAPQRLVLTRGARVNGKVVDEKKNAIGGVEISYEGWLSSDARAQLVTGKGVTAADGTFTLSPVPKSDVLFTFQKDGFADQGFVVKVGATNLDLRSIVLEKGRTVKVRVTDTEGKPIANAVVKWGRGRNAHVSARGYLARDCEIAAETDACVLTKAFRVKGRYVEPVRLKIAEGGRDRYERVEDDGSFDIDLEPEKSFELGFLSVTAAPLTVRVQGKGGEVRDLGELRPDAGRVAVGRITRADGEPVYGARVWTPRPAAGGLIVSWATGNVAQTDSREDGSFRLTGLPSEPCVLRVESPGAARTMVAIGAGEQGAIEDVGTVTLSEGGTVIVRTNDTATEATAFAKSAAGSLDFDAVSVPLTAGIARLRNVPLGTAHISVVTASRTVICEGDVRVDEGEIDYPCEQRRVHVTGDVIVGDAPASGGTLYWNSTGAEVSSPGLIMTNRSAGGMISQWVYGVEGAPIVVPINGSGHFEADLGAGQYRVSWSTNQSALSPDQLVHIPNSETHAVRLVFGGGTIRGNVVDSEGAPVVHATVMELTSHATGISDEQGNFDIRSAPIGKCRVQARTGVRSSSVEEVIVSSDAPGSVNLTITHHLERLRVRVLTADGVAASGAFVFASAGGNSIETVTTDITGASEFVFPGGFSNQARFAVAYGARWYFGPWLSETDLQAPEIGLRVPTDTGGVAVLSAHEAGALDLQTSEGWDISKLFAILGSKPVVTPGVPTRVEGLPAGIYTIRVSGATKTAQVRGGSLTTISLP